MYNPVLNPEQVDFPTTLITVMSDIVSACVDMESSTNCANCQPATRRKYWDATLNSCDCTYCFMLVVKVRVKLAEFS